MAFSNPAHFVTGKARLSYVHLTKPYARDEKQTPKYEVTILIPKTDTATKARLDAALSAAIAKARKTDDFKNIPVDKIKTPLYDGDGFRADGYTPFGAECKGHWVLTARSINAPAVVDLAKNPIIDASEIYSGMYGRVGIDFFAFSVPGNKGISAGLGNVQKVADGEQLGAPRASVDDDFEDDDESMWG